MAKWKISDEEFERQYETAFIKGEERSKTEPQAAVVSYKRKTNELSIRLKNGASFTVPVDLLWEFRGADPDDIAKVEVRPRGAELHWEKLDQDFTVGGLIASVFGDEVLMAEMGRKGGSAQSEAKAAAARENGRKGGRPAKEIVARNYLTVEAISPPENLVFAATQVADAKVYHFSSSEWVKLQELKECYSRQIATKDKLSGGLFVDPNFMDQVLTSVKGLYKDPDFQVNASAKDETTNEELAVAA